MASTSELPSGQHAFTYALYAYDPRISDREEVKAICTNQLRKTATFGERKKQVAAAHSDGNSKRPTLVPCAKEDVPDLSVENMNTAIVVGVHLSEDPSTAPVEKGASIDSLRKLVKSKYDPTALRVVCPRFRNTATYYALTSQDPVTKLCDGVMVDGAEVYFYPEFRDDKATAEQKRRDTWGEKIRKSLSKTDGKKRREQQVRDLNKFFVEEETGLGGEISSFSLGYRLTGSASYLNTAKRLLEKLEPEMRDPSFTGNINLCKLLSGGDLGDDQCEDAFKEIEALWPAVGENIGGSEQLRYIRDCIKAAGKTVPYSHARMFLVICNRFYAGDIESGDFDTDEEIELACIDVVDKTTAEIDLLIGEASPPTADASQSNIATLCDSTASTFDGIADLVDKKLSHLKIAQAGSNRTAASVPELWEGLGSSFEQDSAKLFGLGLHKFSVQGVSKIFDDVTEKLRTSAAYYRELGEKAKDVEDEEGEGDESEDDSVDD